MKAFFPQTFAVKAELEHCLRMGQKMLLPWMSERRFSCRESAARRRCRRLLTLFVAQARAVASIKSEDRKGDGGARGESPVPELIRPKNT